MIGDDPTGRPTTEVRDVLLTGMDRMYGQLAGRLDGLGVDEYLWEPAADCWSVRDRGDGAPIVDGAGVREVDPAPITTIAWRLWHLAVDCFDDYTRRFGSDDSPASAEWTLDPDEAIERLEASWGTYRSTIAARDWWSPLGPDWEMWSEHCVADMAAHASNELVHHAAEIALLRDLWRHHHTT